MATKSRKKDWVLESAEGRNKLYKNSFKIPSREVRENLKPGFFAKLIFTADDPPSAERMWVEITQAEKGIYTGILRSGPVTSPLKDYLMIGSEIHFGARHICSVGQPEVKHA